LNTTVEKVKFSKDITFDPWNNQAEEDDPSKGFLDIVKKKGVRKPPKLIPSKLPAVEVEAPGSSYNPTFEDHQDVIAIAVAQETARIEKEKKMNVKLKGSKRKGITLEDIEDEVKQAEKVDKQEEGKEKGENKEKKRKGT